ncbi:hypothetical protein EW146_g11 [Bondarzewia mesenterica]|uniref:Carbohydrate-binding module family 19 domain-containing protein n=1 Tax=Bondarzewia mesenterica TaxID=1095465 RepID=A0A4S4M8T9_9AGAM|nr:hypothetical protein EW146_g11 [Bondarzewia mesenterica]
MIQLTSLFVTFLAASTVYAIPLQKRIAQTIADSTQAWVKACTTAGGADKCNTISQTAFTSLLAAGKNCDQQDAADSMIDLAKQLNNDPEMIRLAQIFVQQPRNAPDSLQVPYCQTAPKNAELSGLFHCQFASSDFTKFSGDQTGNLPLDVNAVNPPGSCPAKTDGPVPDGVQLNTLVQSPGTPIGGSGSSNSTINNATATATASAIESAANATTTATASGLTENLILTGSSSSISATSDTPSGSVNNTGGGSANTTSFAFQNGKDAQAQNAKFASLTVNSVCQDGEQACIASAFAQCVGGKFVSTQCPGGTQCFALPLVNKAGTSIVCANVADATQRIAATGVTGGLTGA